MTQQEKEKQAICNCLLQNRPFGETAVDIQEAISELRKPSEDLVQEIEKIIWDNIDCEGVQFESEVELVATEIAQLLSSSRSQENEVNKGLLEAAKDALKTFYGVGCTDDAEIVQELKEAIYNAQKQMKS